MSYGRRWVAKSGPAFHAHCGKRAAWSTCKRAPLSDRAPPGLGGRAVGVPSLCRPRQRHDTIAAALCALGTPCISGSVPNIHNWSMAAGGGAAPPQRRALSGLHRWAPGAPARAGPAPADQTKTAPPLPFRRLQPLLELPSGSGAKGGQGPASGACCSALLHARIGPHTGRASPPPRPTLLPTGLYRRPQELESAAFGNPHSTNPSSLRTERLVEDLRRRVLRFLGCVADAASPRTALAARLASHGCTSRHARSIQRASNTCMLHPQRTHTCIMPAAVQGGPAAVRCELGARPCPNRGPGILRVPAALAAPAPPPPRPQHLQRALVASCASRLPHHPFPHTRCPPPPGRRRWCGLARAPGRCGSWVRPFPGPPPAALPTWCPTTTACWAYGSTRGQRGPPLARWRRRRWRRGCARRPEAARMTPRTRPCRPSCEEARAAAAAAAVAARAGPTAAARGRSRTAGGSCSRSGRSRPRFAAWAMQAATAAQRAVPAWRRAPASQSTACLPSQPTTTLQG